MPEIIAQKILDLDLIKLIELLRNIQTDDSGAFDLIKDKLEDLI